MLSCTIDSFNTFCLVSLESPRIRSFLRPIPAPSFYQNQLPVSFQNRSLSWLVASIKDRSDELLTSENVFANRNGKDKPAEMAPVTLIST